jgi:FtsP/CotA-like multicopper oxidase with cupredoxin domain
MKLCCLIVFCASAALFAQEPLTLDLSIRTITVNGRSAPIYCLRQPNGAWGMAAEEGELFDVILRNLTDQPTAVHWHGLLLPNSQDGAACVTQFPIYPGERYYYRFPLTQAGTYWMHAHYSFQIQHLLSAPLILRAADEKSLADQEAVVLFTDFSFTEPERLFAQLRCRRNAPMMRQDLVDVDYDAFLANFRTLDAPEVVDVKPGARVRLRLINGSSATNFFLSLGGLQGTAIAVDGNRIEPLSGAEFELAVAQRIDLIVTIPPNGGAFPVLAQGEGTDKRAGVILASSGAPLPQLSSRADKRAGALTNAHEAQLRPLHPLPPKSVDRRLVVALGGDMISYVWTINDQAWPNITPILVREGERVELTFRNDSAMAHPMHLHGHVFQVTALNGKLLSGPMRDTVLVLPRSSVTVQFDATHPGVWPLHCHNLYHQEGGMMTLLRYFSYER